MVDQPELVPNATLLIQLLIFLASFVVLRFLVFKPYLSLIHGREEKSTGLQNKAKGLQTKAEDLKVQYENFMMEERAKLSDWIERERKEISDEERRIIQEAKLQVGSELQSVRKSIRLELQKIEQQLSPSIPEYASQLVSNLLGRNVTVSPTLNEKKTITPKVECSRIS